MIARITAAVLMCGVVAGCGLSVADDVLPADERVDVARSKRPDPSWTVPPPGPLKGELRRADVLVIGQETLSSRLRVAIEGLDEVRAAEVLTVASVPLGSRTITVAAADPDGLRQFTPRSTARSDAVWRSVADGEIAVTHGLGRALDLKLGGQLGLRAGQTEVPLRVGAYAETVPGLDGVVNHRRAEQLGMWPDNAVLLSVRGSDALKAVKEAVGKRANVVPLVSGRGGQQLAYLTGGAVAKAVGTFQYRYYPDGSVRPDPDWVASNIRTESVPILGNVTCHRVMLPQLRSALAEVEARGLTDRIDVGDYGGCYVPRFIGHDSSNGLSLHTWGIAVDLNVAGNQRGTRGEIDREVVRIFKRWGFAWGGDWTWTDPMHFELAALVR